MSNTPNTELPPPTEAIANPWQQYVEQRFNNTEVYMPSYLSRTLGRPLEQAEQDRYKAEVIKAGNDITKSLGIDQTLFQDPKYAEVFLSIADSWALNEHRLDRFSDQDPTYTEERDFLIHVTRLLTGNSSRYNLKALEERKPHANYYADPRIARIPMSHDIYGDLSEHEISEILTHTNATATQKIKQLCDEGNGPFKAIREKLLESTEGLGEKWDIAVIGEDDSVGKGATFESIRGLGNIATAFVTSFQGKEMLILPQPMAKRILAGEKTDVETFIHELTHIFRNESVILGDTRQLGLILNEQAAWLVSEQLQGHFDVTFLFKLMNMTQQDMPLNDANNWSVNKVFLDALKTNDLATFYQYLSDHFGLRSLLLLMTYMPSANYLISHASRFNNPFGMNSVKEVQETHRQHDVQDFVRLDAKRVVTSSNSDSQRLQKQAEHHIALISASLLQTVLSEALRIGGDENLKKNASDRIDTSPTFLDSYIQHKYLPTHMRQIFQDLKDQTS